MASSGICRHKLTHTPESGGAYLLKVANGNPAIHKIERVHSEAGTGWARRAGRELQTRTGPMSTRYERRSREGLPAELLPPREAWTSLKQEAGEGDREEMSRRCAEGTREPTRKRRRPSWEETNREKTQKGGGHERGVF